jgi:group I intron endonuclease
MSIGIYKIENLINHKIYIGQSVEIEKRWQKHLSAKDDFVIHRALHKYGKENFSFQIIEECNLLDLDKKEKYWITYYNSLVPNGYNMIQGGSNGAGFAKGKKVLQYSLNGEFLEKYSSANQASLITGIDHWSICACCRGEYRQAGGYQWKYSEDKEKEIKSIKKRTNYEVLQIDVKTDEIIQEFSSIKEATAKTNIASSTICNVCNGKGKTAGGFKWKYKK